MHLEDVVLDRTKHTSISRVILGYFFMYCILTLHITENVSASDSIPVKFKFEKVFFLDIAKKNKHLLCVGERGLIFRSKDEGQSWQSIQLHNEATLTSVVFVNDTAYVVGHRGSLYRSNDWGKSFSKINLTSLLPDDTLLRIKLISKDHIVVVGAWGLFLESIDGGKNWKKQKIISEEFDWHLYDAIKTPSGIIAVGEAGTIIFRKDGVKTWNKINPSYTGSFFGILKEKNKSFFLYGMRGKIFNIVLSETIYTSKKINLKKLETYSNSTWMSGLTLKNKSHLFFGDGGLVGKKNKGFELTNVPLNSVNAGVELSNGSVFLVGLNGGFMFEQ